MKESKGKLPLSPLESKVMDLIWSKGEVTAEIVRTELKMDSPLTDSTVRTILRRLEAKEYLKHRVEGRTYVYQPSIASQNVAVAAVKSIVERFCNGSLENLLIGLVDKKVVSADKLKELADKIEKLQVKEPTNRRE